MKTLLAIVPLLPIVSLLPTVALVPIVSVVPSVSLLPSVSLAPSVSLLSANYCSPLLQLAAAPPVERSPADVDELTARTALRRAAEFQRGEVPRPRPNAFRAEFFVTAVDRRDGSTINADVSRTYVRRPERMLTTRKDTLVNSDSTVGFDGEVVWFRDNASGKVRRYTDDPVAFETDLENVDFHLRLMPILLDAVVVDALIPRLQSPRLLRRSQHTDQLRKSHDVEVIVAEMDDELFGADPGAPPPMPDAPPPKLLVQLGIDAATGALWWFRLETLGREEPILIELVFDLHDSTHDGLVVPGNIKIYEHGNRGTDMTASLGVLFDETIEDEDILLFELDPDLDESIFAVPDDE